MNDDDQENNGEAKTDNDDESEDGVFGLTTVIDLKKHKVNERESFFKFFTLIVSHWDQENCAMSSITGMKRSVFKML